MDKQIVIYDPVTMLPRYTVEPPYTDEVRQFYIDLAEADATIAFAEVDRGTIMNKCVDISDEIPILVDRPTQDLVGTLEGNIYTVTNIKPNTLLTVDNGNSYPLGDLTTLSLELDTPGNYTLHFVIDPYQECELIVEYAP